MVQIGTAMLIKQRILLILLLILATNSQSGDAKAQYTQVDCGDATNIDNVEIDQLQARKLLYKGALYLIMPNGDIYNTAGTLINQQ